MERIECDRRRRGMREGAEMAKQMSVALKAMVLVIPRDSGSGREGNARRRLEEPRGLSN